MKNKFKIAFGIVLIVISLFAIIGGKPTGGFFLLVAGFMFLPYVKQRMQQQYSFFKKPYTSILLSLPFFLLSLSMIFDSDNAEAQTKDTETAEVNVNLYKFQAYLDRTERQKATLDKEAIISREKALNKLYSNITYQVLVDSHVVDAKYLPLLDAIAHGVSTIAPNGFTMDSKIHDRLEETEFKFVVKSIAISQPIRGGLTKDIINVFDRYRSRYGIYGEEGVFIDVGTGNKERIAYDFDLSPVFVMLEPKNHAYLNALYEARAKGISNWSDEGEYAFPYLSTYEGYNEHVKQVYPESRYVINADFELSASQLYSEYQANEIAADNMFKGKKLAVSGVIEDIGNDIMDDSYITLSTGDLIGSVQCYLDKKVISQLQKGQKVTVIGRCNGLMMNVLMEDCFLWDS